MPIFRRTFGYLLAALGTAASGPATASQSVLLPAWECTQFDAIYRAGFEAGEVAIPHDPSAGSGGTYPGNVSRVVHIAGLGSGTQTYYVYLPPDYTPQRAWPLLLALHGTAAGGGQDAAATSIRSAWRLVAGNARLIVVAPVANDTFVVGNQVVVSWLTPPSSPNDYDLFAAVRADLEAAYNIDRARIYGWGFSAGGHVMHDLGMNPHSSAFNATTMAAYSVSAGNLQALACAGLDDAGCNAVLAAVPRKIPVDIHVGTSDPMYPDVSADYARLLSQGWSDGQTVDLHTFDGGHDYSSADLQIAWSVLCRNAIAP